MWDVSKAVVSNPDGQASLCPGITLGSGSPRPQCPWPPPESWPVWARAWQCDCFYSFQVSVMLVWDGNQDSGEGIFIGLCPGQTMPGRLASPVPIFHGGPRPRPLGPLTSLLSIFQSNDQLLFLNQKSYESNAHNTYETLGENNRQNKNYSQSHHPGTSTI